MRAGGVAFGNLHLAFANGMHDTVLDGSSDILLISINSTSLSGDHHHHTQLFHPCECSTSVRILLT